MIKLFNKLNNIIFILLIILLVLLLMDRSNREGFEDFLDSSLELYDFSYNEVPEIDNRYSKFEKNICGPIVPGQFFFATTKFDHSCCNDFTLYSNNKGCACICPEQLQFLNKRGDNCRELSEY